MWTCVCMNSPIQTLCSRSPRFLDSTKSSSMSLQAPFFPIHVMHKILDYVSSKTSTEMLLLGHKVHGWGYVSEFSIAQDMLYLSRMFLGTEQGGRIPIISFINTNKITPKLKLQWVDMHDSLPFPFKERFPTTMICCDQEFYKALRVNMKALEGSRRKRNKQMVL